MMQILHSVKSVIVRSLWTSVRYLFQLIGENILMWMERKIQWIRNTSVFIVQDTIRVSLSLVLDTYRKTELTAGVIGTSCPRNIMDLSTTPTSASSVKTGLRILSPMQCITSTVTLVRSSFLTPISMLTRSARRSSLRSILRLLQVILFHLVWSCTLIPTQLVVTLISKINRFLSLRIFVVTPRMFMAM